MTKAELTEIVKYFLQKDEGGLSSTQIFVWGLVAAAGTGLIIWAVKSVIKTIKLENRAMIASSEKGIDKLIVIQEMHVEELSDVKKQQIKAGLERSKMLDAIGENTKELKDHRERIEKIEDKG